MNNIYIAKWTNRTSNPCNIIIIITIITILHSTLPLTLVCTFMSVSYLKKKKKIIHPSYQPNPVNINHIIYKRCWFCSRDMFCVLCVCFFMLFLFLFLFLFVMMCGFVFVVLFLLLYPFSTNRQIYKQYIYEALNTKPKTTRSFIFDYININIYIYIYKYIWFACCLTDAMSGFNVVRFYFEIFSIFNPQ